ncbi:MAG: efflux RND transporter periplasmic adaptor subunit [Planctomycetota bacterium]
MRLIVRIAILGVLVAGAVWVGLAIRDRLAALGATEKRAVAAGRPAPVEVAEISRGPIELRRVFSGTIEAQARVSVAPKVSGRVLRIAVDLGDAVRRGDVVAELDNDEFRHAVTRAEASLAVARAKLAEARAALEIAQRGLERVESLRKQGIATDEEHDEARAELSARSAAVEVAEAEVARADSEVATATTRLGYTRVTAEWTGGEELRYVAERMVDPGDTVAGNQSLVSIVELDPVKAVFHVTEADYGRLEVGQEGTIATTALPGEEFRGAVARIAPAFRNSSRQARVEMSIRNPDRHLKPGMFVRAELVLDRRETATIVPAAALAQRGGRPGVFVLGPAGERVSWRPVTVGIREGERVEIGGEGLEGRVVTLGHQLIDDGSAVILPGSPAGGGAESE